MITYRPFRNWDPPGLVRIWNASMTGRGLAQNIQIPDLDRLIFSKPYFDPKGLIVAEYQSQIVGFCHAGFGAGGDDAQLSRSCGVIAMLMVEPDFRRKGIGQELVRRGEKYLRDSGSTIIYAGGIHPLDPFYIGLYGGSELPGILRSNPIAHHLFQSLGYEPVDECVVFQREMGKPMPLIDPRARRWVRRVEMTVVPHPPPPSWWSACRYSCVDNTLFEAKLKDSGKVIGRAMGWEMYPLERSWGADAVGIVDVQVDEEYRNQGLGIFLVTQILRHYHNTGLSLAEVQTMNRNTAAQKLYRRLGFKEIDRGVVYRAPPGRTS